MEGKQNSPKFLLLDPLCMSRDAYLSTLKCRICKKATAVGWWQSHTPACHICSDSGAWKRASRTGLCLMGYLGPGMLILQASLGAQGQPCLPSSLVLPAAENQTLACLHSWIQILSSAIMWQNVRNWQRQIYNTSTWLMIVVGVWVFKIKATLLPANISVVNTASLPYKISRRPFLLWLK